ncbi:DUF3040 domain-containing protein [Microterricola pindariensis]|uniref:DUF3040 domain-containing protein n=1 Tax=Microterricola pindariensis TaxID=478010 RepID=A0ABX5AUN6_9MICO|nr:DUF3040 domain-containing protein [Microterricola pindariensis]PPL18613.1 hypothetical protein GY24_10365 [Microterricola pindariensis]
MPLSEQEQRLLEEMERSLYRNDADFVATVGAPRGRPSYRSIALGVLITVAGIGGLLAGVMLHQLVIGIIGFVVMFGGVLLAIKPSRSIPVEPPASARGKAHPSRADTGFMDKMNNRWDRRQDGQE